MKEFLTTISAGNQNEVEICAVTETIQFEGHVETVVVRWIAVVKSNACAASSIKMHFSAGGLSELCKTIAETLSSLGWLPDHYLEILRADGMVLPNAQNINSLDLN
jgi:hypothetical protein